MMAPNRNNSPAIGAHSTTTAQEKMISSFMSRNQSQQTHTNKGAEFKKSVSQSTGVVLGSKLAIEPQNVTLDMVHELLAQLPAEDEHGCSTEEHSTRQSVHEDEEPGEAVQAMAATAPGSALNEQSRIFTNLRHATVNEITRKRNLEVSEMDHGPSKFLKVRSRQSSTSTVDSATELNSPAGSVVSMPYTSSRPWPKENARAIKYPPEAEFSTTLNKPLFQCLEPGGPELNALEQQKLIDATSLLEELNIHILEPLTLYNRRQLYELMASVTEVWKNSGKAAWRKRINKIRGNARSRIARKNVLEDKELQEIAELEAKIKQREIWEQQEKLKLSILNQQKLDDRTTINLKSVNIVPAPSELPTAKKLARYRSPLAVAGSK